MNSLSLNIDEDEDHRYKKTKIPTILVEYTLIECGADFVFIRNLCRAAPEF